MSIRNRHNGVVYLIGSEVVRVVKIGITRGTAQSRLRSLQTGCPFPLTLFGCFPGYSELEQKLHRTFRPLWIHGEWFELAHKLRDFTGYIQSYAEMSDTRLITEDDLDCALHDCIWSGLGYPEMDQVAYDSSAVRSEWAEVYDDA